MITIKHRRLVLADNWHELPPPPGMTESMLDRAKAENPHLRRWDGVLPTADPARHGAIIEPLTYPYAGRSKSYPLKTRYVLQLSRVATFDQSPDLVFEFADHEGRVTQGRARPPTGWSFVPRCEGDRGRPGYLCDADPRAFVRINSGAAVAANRAEFRRACGLARADWQQSDRNQREESRRVLRWARSARTVAEDVDACFTWETMTVNAALLARWKIGASPSALHRVIADYLSDDPTKAAALRRKKARITIWRLYNRAIQQQRINDECRDLADTIPRETVITLADAYDAGFCRRGTREYAARLGLELSDGGTIEAGALLDFWAATGNDKVRRVLVAARRRIKAIGR